MAKATFSLNSDRDNDDLVKRLEAHGIVAEVSGGEVMVECDDAQMARARLEIEGDPNIRPESTSEEPTTEEFSD